MNENRLTIEQLFTDNKNVHTQMILSYEDPNFIAMSLLNFFTSWTVNVSIILTVKNKSFPAEMLLF